MAKCILIDNDALVLLKVAETLDQALYWAELLAPTHDFSVLDLSGRHFAAYTEYELRRLYHQLSGQNAPDNVDWIKLRKGVMALADEVPVDHTPLEDLKARLGRDLKPVDPKPVPEKGGRKTSGGTAPTALSRPKPGTTTGKVWEVADALYAESGAVPDRQAVVEKCSALDINPSTASTQFGKWKRFLNSGSN